jgi:hypothetical protein
MYSPATVERSEGRLPFSGAMPPEGGRVRSGRFLALLDTEVYWEVA